MLEIINNLKIFFEDNYMQIGVREYARMHMVSPPSASKRLKLFEKENLLCSEEEKRYLYFFANRESSLFVSLQRVYYSEALKEIGFIDYIEKSLVSPVVILFGSVAKAETNKNSDIDIAIFTISEKKLDISDFEKKVKRNIQVFIFNNRESVKNKMLLNNILNGLIISGSW